ncbi:MAG: ATP-dependent Clp protease, protease subunit [Myxococcales bacterium]|jgi:ATP-dependent Clp protease protease subunit|nr:ATP-dependent Clp protease, protease subunit [Myxococcales bacterium]
MTFKRPENRAQAMSILESASASGFLASVTSGGSGLGAPSASGVLIPNVVETTHRGERGWSIFDRLLKDRIVFLYDEIHDMLANVIIAQFLFLESEDPDKEIMVYINSPGGVVTSGLAIHDTMQYVRCDVSTTCLGMAASMAAVLLAAGTKGRRNALPNARVMIHQPMGGARGQASDIEIQAREIRHLKDVLTDILVNATGKAKDQVHKDIDRDFYLSAAAAKEYGLIDNVMLPPKKRGDGTKEK